MAFVKATKKKAKGRIVIHGPAGAGKTRTALKIAERMLGEGQRIAFIDAEEGSASKYSDIHDFDVEEFTDSFDPKALLVAVHNAAESGYGVVVIDSLTPFWKGKGGFLEMVDQAAARRSRGGGKQDTFSAWKDIDAVYINWLHELWKARIHIIFTIKAKMTREKNAEGKIQTVGYQPEFRDDFIYIPDIELVMDADHRAVVGKCRCDALDGKVFTKPGADFADVFMGWLSSGVEEAAPSVPPPPPPPQDDFLTRVAAATTKDAVEALKAEFQAHKETLTAEQKQAEVLALKAAIGRVSNAA